MFIPSVRQRALVSKAFCDFGELVDNVPAVATALSAVNMANVVVAQMISDAARFLEANS